MKSLDLLPQNWDEEIEGDSPDMGSEDLGSEEVRAANMLRALANPHRLKILKLLDRAPHTVMDICERLNLRQSLASQHLARLRIDGVVTAERQGHHVVYSLQNGRVREILAVLDGARTTTRARRKRVNGAGSTNGRGA
jgi:ArsR family transcriptional regulator, virulence genes transcriptional regulator